MNIHVPGIPPGTSLIISPFRNTSDSIIMNRNILAAMGLVTVSCVGVHATDSYNDWMRRLDDRAYLHQVSIPGSHDAGTGNGTALDAFARTQDLTIEEQFDAGIRAFDLRPSVKDGTLQIYHGSIRTNVSFDEALSTLCSRLDANPTEFAIVIMRHEDDHESDFEKQHWNTLVRQTLNDNRYAGRFVEFREDRTVGEIRGKILILSRDRYTDKPIGGFIDSWTHSADISDQSRPTIIGANTTRPTQLYVQDFYEVKDDMDLKLSSILTLLDLSTTFNRTESHTWVINHTSGYCNTGIASRNAYRANAASTNSAVVDYLSEEPHAGPTGMVMMDFAGVDSSGDYEVNGRKLIDAVVENNFRYAMRGDKSGAGHISADSPSGIKVSAHGEITASGPISVYGTSGTQIATGTDRVTVPRPGLYIIQASSSVRKLSVR